MMFATSMSAASGEKPSLRLLTQRLTEVDAAKLDVFLRIGRSQLQCDWSIVSDGTAHVLVVAGQDTDTVPGLLDDPRATLHVLDYANAAQAESWTQLIRPLQYEAFTDALVRVERMVLQATAAPRPVAPAPAAAPTRDPALALGAGYRLRRWPSADLLRGHRYHTRLASFMSTRHVELDELAQLSNVSRSDCIAFVSHLLKADLLDVKSTPLRLPEPSAALATAAARPPAVSRKRPDAGLFGKIRHSLGMR